MSWSSRSIKSLLQFLSRPEVRHPGPGLRLAEQLPDLGETLQSNIRAWFENEDNWFIWYELRELVQIAPPPPPQETTDSPFAGLTIVVTGKVEPYTREGINAKIESLGAHAGSSVSSKTDYLVCGENAGSKLEKAQALGIKILTPTEFFRMAGE